VNGNKCDGPGCGTFSVTSAGWLFLLRSTPEPSYLSLLGGGGSTEVKGTFCSPRCVAEFCYVMAVTADKAVTVPEPDWGRFKLEFRLEPPPETGATGTGWPG
jgi:hypothetical protein